MKKLLNLKVKGRELKNRQIKIRVTENEYSYLLKYAKKNKATMTDVLRAIFDKYMSVK